ncbi:PREDICTED: putative ATP-dependent RNA helicase TDRD12 [Habropoda laboriosa]|uniref:putative ATP-dependent RNA helicase TDRD12 n=1 Tax=Habropoda laboriosa TaxID=597456 RepID=UPI00083CC6AE|nr:PREDICTED: putative ATP-dependent RNA helicase TDRD12 [Habropoda laboriosa]
MLPSTATTIRVTNILTPYIIRIYELKHYDEKLNLINKQLLTKRGTFNSIKTRAEPNIGDIVIVHNKSDIAIDLPGWLCRGYISGIGNLKNTYNILLRDYGISITLQREDFIICAIDLILEEDLSFTVGLYNVLPVVMKYDSSVHKEILEISKEWDMSAIEYTRGLISLADAIYFDYLASDQYGKHYGEFYFNIKDNIIRLSEALILNHYAIYLEEGNLMNIYEKQTKFQKEKNLHDELQRDKEKVITYGVDKYECLNSTFDAKFPAEIHKAWKSLVQSSKPRKIQSCIWPALQNGSDIIAIGTAKCGKTIGYGFAVCGLLATNPNLPQGINPSALILCSSSSKVLEVNSLCTEFLQSYKTIRSVAAVNGKTERSLVAEMFNGCQILVSTPNFLTRFMNINGKLLNFQNLQYLILDDGDVILDKYFNSVSKLFKKHKIIWNREMKNKVFQIIITATHWTPHLRKIASVLMNNPYVCIASYIEAAVFRSVQPKVYIINSKKKDEKILDILCDEYAKVRTIIVCINNEEAEKLYNFLVRYKEILLAHENMNFVHLQGIKQYWNAYVNGSYPIFICTDDVLSDISITNASWLIHYSVPLRSKTKFSFRFSTLLDSLQMLITAALDREKKDYPICDNIKSWGFCNKEASCAFRHRVISEIDVPVMNIQINDKVKLRVVSIHDVTHFSARIISYIKFDTSEEIEFSSTEYMQITIKIQEFYSDAKNRKRCDIIDIGCVCGLEEPIDTFKRVQIFHIERDETGCPKLVDVKCIDNGVILNKVNVFQLLYMPEELIKYPTQVIEVFLTGIVPHDNEYMWNNNAVDAVYQWFKENVDERSYVIGTVNLHLGNTIWVNTLEVGTKLLEYKDLIGLSLKTELIKKEHAIKDDKHLNQMYQLCRDAGFSKINGYNIRV